MLCCSCGFDLVVMEDDLVKQLALSLPQPLSESESDKGLSTLSSSASLAYITKIKRKSPPHTYYWLSTKYLTSEIALNRTVYPPPSLVLLFFSLLTLLSHHSTHWTTLHTIVALSSPPTDTTFESSNAKRTFDT